MTSFLWQCTQSSSYTVWHVYQKLARVCLKFLQNSGKTCSVYNIACVYIFAELEHSTPQSTLSPKLAPVRLTQILAPYMSTPPSTPLPLIHIHPHHPSRIWSPTIHSLIFFLCFLFRRLPLCFRLAAKLSYSYPPSPPPPLVVTTTPARSICILILLLSISSVSLSFHPPLSAFLKIITFFINALSSTLQIVLCQRKLGLNPGLFRLWHWQSFARLDLIDDGFNIFRYFPSFTVLCTAAQYSKYSTVQHSTLTPPILFNIGRWKATTTQRRSFFLLSSSVTFYYYPSVSPPSVHCRTIK